LSDAPRDKPAISGKKKALLHSAAVVLFGAIAYVIAAMTAPSGGLERTVMTVAFWFGLTYLYAMLFVSAWARKRFERSQGEVQDNNADFGL
jgi:hypothetical protein